MQPRPQKHVSKFWNKEMYLATFLLEPKCSSEVSGPKWASVHTTLCEGSYWYSGSHMYIWHRSHGAWDKFGGCPPHVKKQTIPCTSIRHPRSESERYLCILLNDVLWWRSKKDVEVEYAADHVVRYCWKRIWLQHDVYKHAQLLLSALVSYCLHIVCLY